MTSTTTQPRKFSWPQGKRCGVSISFDDARPSQLDNGVPILNKHGVRATFYVSPEWFKRRLPEWKAAIACGHEIGNHSLKHPCSGNFPWSRDAALENYTLEAMEAELREANKFIEDLTGVTPTTFAYPCGQTFVGRGPELRSYIPVVSKLFLAGRCFRDESPNDPAYSDFARLAGTDFDGADVQLMKEMLDMARQNGQWLLLAAHDVGEKKRQTVESAVLDEFCRYCTDPANEVWIDTVDAVARYVSNARKPATV